MRESGERSSAGTGRIERCKAQAAVVAVVDDATISQRRRERGIEQGSICTHAADLLSHHECTQAWREGDVPRLRPEVETRSSRPAPEHNPHASVTAMPSADAKASYS